MSKREAESKAEGDAKRARGSGSDDKRVVLAYSGGLDTSVILCWLIEKGYTVIAYCANVGQVHDDVTKIKAKALKCGAEKCYVEDLRKEFVTDYIFPFLRSGAMYEGRYLLGTTVARPLIAKRQVEIAHMENCKFIAHGATGKGNDQVRFELCANALDPTIQMIAPWRDDEFLKQFEGRVDLLDYAAKHGIQVDQTKKASYSMDENMLHISYESGVLEDTAAPPPDGMFKLTRDLKDTPDEFEDLRIEYKAGNPVRVTNKTTGEVKEDPVELFVYCNQVAGKHGIGRIDIVENRFVGMKSRGVYETPGGKLLFDAHQDLEGITVDRGVLRMRDLVAQQYATIMYNGFYFSPEMDFCMTALDKAQELVDGFVDVRLHKGHVIVRGRGSKLTRYSESIASMDESGDYYPADAVGFIRLNALRLKTHHALMTTLKKEDPERFAALKTMIPKP